MTPSAVPFRSPFHRAGPTSSTHMMRSEHFDFIEGRLNWLVERLKSRGAINILNLHVHSEDFYAHFLNLLFGWKLENLNLTDQNAPAIDLVDRTLRIVAQVSATGTKTKINSALGKARPEFDGYAFRFICIVRSDERLRDKSYRTDHKLTFTPTSDIYDTDSLLKVIKALPSPRMEAIRDFIKSELRIEADPSKVESNIATIIKSMTAEDWNGDSAKAEVIPYDIEAKISHNQLGRARMLIDEYRIHHHRLKKIYSEYDQLGSNKSLSVLNGIRREFMGLDNALGPDDQFFGTIARVKARIQGSANHAPMPEEELDLCVEILVVDAFIRCKIFKNPLAVANARS